MAAPGIGEQRPVHDKRYDFVLKLRRVATAQNVLRDKIRHPLCFTKRHAQSQKIFAIHFYCGLDAGDSQSRCQ